MLKYSFVLPLTLLCSLFTGCGFQLRHTMVIPPQLQSLYLQSNRPFSSLMKQFKQELASSGIALEEKPSAAKLIFQILHDDISQQFTNISANNQVSQYLRTYSVTYQITTPNGYRILGPLTTSSSRTITLIANQLLSDTYNLNQIQEDLQRDVIVKILYRLKSPTSLKYLTHETTL